MKIPDSKLMGLEFVRGFAALMVMAGHIFLYLKDLEKYSGGHLTGFLLNWGRECVLLFFILSGIVVPYAFDKKKRSKLQFLKQRIIRLHPTLLISICICLIIEFCLSQKVPPLNTIIGNTIPYSTMPGYLAPLLWNTNAAIWSLTFELFFYVAFGIFIIQTNKIKQEYVYVWLSISILSIYFYFNPISSNWINHFVMMLSFSPVWIIGFLIYRFKEYIYSDNITALLSISILPLTSRLHIYSDNYYNPLMFIVFSLAAIPLFVRLMKPNNFNVIKRRKRTYWLITVIYIISVFLLTLDDMYTNTSKFLYCALPLFTLIMLFIPKVVSFISKIAKEYIIPFFGYFGKYSYPIYLLHTPFIKLVNGYKLPLTLKLLFIVITTFSLSYTIENYIQPYINKKLV